MSKKSRKRNKKILGILAAGLGAAALMKRRKAASVASSDDAGINVTHPALTDSAPAVKKAVVADAAANTGSDFQTRFTKKVDGTWKGPGQILAERRLTAGNKVPPSMRTGAPHAEGYQKYGIIGTDRTGGGRPTIKRGWTGTPSLRAKGGRIGAKKGGSVTGIAKRGFGRALMKGKK